MRKFNRFSQTRVQKLVHTKRGRDGIPLEILKRYDMDHVLDFANKLLIDLEKPDQWSESNIIPIAKTGDLGLVGNYRDIMLDTLALKTTKNDAQSHTINPRTSVTT